MRFKKTFWLVTKLSKQEKVKVIFKINITNKCYSSIHGLNGRKFDNNRCCNSCLARLTDSWERLSRFIVDKVVIDYFKTVLIIIVVT